MRQVLLNQKTVSANKSLKKIQRDSRRGYRRVGSVSKVKMGKLVRVSSATEPVRSVQPLPAQANLAELLTLLEQSQLTGMSGNGFSVRSKIELFLRHDGPKSLLINAAECEPGLLHDEWILENYRDEIDRGILYLRQVISFERCVLAHKVQRRRRERQKETAGYTDYVVPARYPMGEENLLIRQVFGQTVQKGVYPVEMGILVLNVQTVYQVYCLVTNQYRNGRYVTLSDLQTGDARVIFVNRGDSIVETVRKTFPYGPSREIFAGDGILCAEPIGNDAVFQDQISFAAVGTPATLSNTIACRGCGRCNRKCPQGIDIREAVRRIERDPKASVSDLGLDRCIACKSCTFFCGAGKNIEDYLQRYR